MCDRNHLPALLESSKLVVLCKAIGLTVPVAAYIGSRDPYMCSINDCCEGSDVVLVLL